MVFAKARNTKPYQKCCHVEWVKYRYQPVYGGEIKGCNRCDAVDTFRAVKKKILVEGSLSSPEESNLYKE